MRRPARDGPRQPHASRTYMCRSNSVSPACREFCYLGERDDLVELAADRRLVMRGCAVENKHFRGRTVRLMIMNPVPTSSNEETRPRRIRAGRTSARDGARVISRAWTGRPTIRPRMQTDGSGICTMKVTSRRRTQNPGEAAPARDGGGRSQKLI